MSDTDQTLLLAIHPDASCGDDLAFDPLFDVIRDARRADDPALAQGDWEAPLKVADWRQVAQRCRQALATRSKDIQLFAWLAEADTALHGLPATRQQLQLFLQALQQFWPDLHPHIDDDAETRIARLESYDQTLAQAMREVPLAHHDEQRLTLGRWQQLSQLEALIARHPEQRNELIDAGYVSQDEWTRGIHTKGAAFYQQALLDLSHIQHSLQALDELLLTHLAAQAPRFSQTQSASADWRAFAERALRLLGVQQEAPDATSQSSNAHTTPAHDCDAPATPQQRLQALQQLRQIAQFFRQTEPHSPVGYLAARAADWGEMSLEGWLGSVIKDEVQLNGLRELLGVRGDP